MVGNLWMVLMLHRRGGTRLAQVRGSGRRSRGARGILESARARTCFAAASGGCLTEWYVMADRTRNVDRPGPRVAMMPNDAKLGLVVGMMLVVLIALLFFRKDGSSSPAIAAPATSSPTPKAPLRAPKKANSPAPVPAPKKEVPAPAPVMDSSPPEEKSPDSADRPDSLPDQLPEPTPDLPPPAFDSSPAPPTPPTAPSPPATPTRRSIVGPISVPFDRTRIA